MNNAPNHNDYFNLHTTGIGYLQRMREVPVKSGQPYLAVDINALQGKSDNPQKLRFDLIVTGASAEADIDFICGILNEQQLVDPKILVAFKASDLDPQFFTYKKGDKQGQQGVCIKARLIKLKYCKINGVLVDLPSAQAQGDEDEEGMSDQGEGEFMPEPEPTPAPRAAQQAPARQAQPAGAPQPTRSFAPRAGEAGPSAQPARQAQPARTPQPLERSFVPRQSRPSRYPQAAAQR